MSAAICLSLVIVALTGCVAADDPVLSHSEDERASFDARIQHDLRAGEDRRERQLHANRRFLDQLTVFPGAELVSETRQGNTADVDHSELSDAELEYRIYLEEVVRPYERFEIVTAESWSSYRNYRLPVGTDGRAVHRYYTRLFRSWTHSERDRGLGVAGNHFFTDDHYKDGRCVWIHIGLKDSSVEQPRSLMVATMQSPPEDCGA